MNRISKMQLWLALPVVLATVAVRTALEDANLTVAPSALLETAGFWRAS